ncbi:NfeD family protein [Hyphomicrobium sp.]|uniref:NfeD family protein n=1 Tax=Hyphomicrobium sp. TaxID=82 RepID=UPI0025C313D5|nr:NfeD family protein [Hyphomicrobium sp.]MCC7251742.1 NfeD family protein [Hyphomicrobium sp.]
MSALIDFFASLGPWSWVIAGVLLMALETLIPGVYFLWFGISAVVVGVLLFGTGDAISQPWQLVLFALISVATVFAVRRFANLQSVESAEKDLNQRGAQYFGRVVVVEDAISGGRGRVRVDDTLWLAAGADAPKGSRVRITGANGIVFTVEPA